MTNKRDNIRDRRIEELEREFSELLIPCLQSCASGRWGLFGAHDRIKQQNPHPAAGLSWPEADYLRELAALIRNFKSEFGSNNWLCEEFLRRCSMHGANDPGEPKLAASFLEEIEQHETTRSAELR
jgi:hypothetical protein